jgi:hypothetical protein
MSPLYVGNPVSSQTCESISGLVSPVPLALAGAPEEGIPEVPDDHGPPLLSHSRACRAARFEAWCALMF